jgi:hypothetical protein
MALLVRSFDPVCSGSDAVLTLSFPQHLQSNTPGMHVESNILFFSRT